MSSKFSGPLVLTDLNDFIAPSQACIKPVESGKKDLTATSNSGVTCQTFFGEKQNKTLFAIVNIKYLTIIARLPRSKLRLTGATLRLVVMVAPPS